ncbi:MAG: ATP-dependent RecD-like DNA helicase [Bacilli bacterium]|nr:ATP-dependent RecD-like DNA helicase [Bacilli bacterium]
MQWMKGNIKNTIFTSETGYFVGLFRVKECSDDLKDIINKTITIAGLLLNPNNEDTYILHGNYQKHERFGYQFQFESFEKTIPEGKDAVEEFLASSLIKGCGIKTAKAIVDTLGEKALDLIKENRANLFLVPSMTEKKATSIYQSVLSYSSVDDMLVTLRNLGFTIPEATRIVKTYQDKTLVFLSENIYYFKDYVSFDKLDKIFLKNHDGYEEIRIRECTLEVMRREASSSGDTYSYLEEIASSLQNHFKIYLEEEDVFKNLQELEKQERVIIEGDKIYLFEYYEMESTIAHILKRKMSYPDKTLRGITSKLSELENRLEVTYNKEQKTAIEKALKYPVSIISGGPGTGKTTIVNAIVKLYIEYYKLSPIDIATQIALLAPTGRAAKKLSTSTGLPAQTIHRYLKWNKETNDFGINEFNKNYQKLLIIDETSMIDTHLFYSLLKGTQESAQFVLVGDTFQLPSVGAGLILNDLVKSGLFAYTSLETIYRQSENSYIPILAKEIKEKQISSRFDEKTDDYNFIACDSRNLKSLLEKIIQKSIEKNLKADDIQILAPMYKGENGIDALNVMLQNLFNPPSKKKKEYAYYDVIYREGDKVLQLVNNPDCNVYNGDIGHILSIDEKTLPKKHLEIRIDFDGNQVIYQREDLPSIKHAYAMTVHKSQGSEFSHVILPITKHYYKMLYNKLIYTGVSRAKKSLVIIGEAQALQMGVLNDYSSTRKTSLKEKLENIFDNERTY